MENFQSSAADLQVTGVSEKQWGLGDYEVFWDWGEKEVEKSDITPELNLLTNMCSPIPSLWSLWSFVFSATDEVSPAITCSPDFPFEPI